MISEQKLKEVCENYKIDFKKLIDSNPNILEFGDYTEICYVLDYLRLNVGIMPSNIEKCPSILYRNVSNIKSNYKFLKSKRINIKEVESCLHVLKSDSQQLKDTFKYVKQNYGLKSIERITSILAVAVDIIKSVENLNIGFKNKIDNLSVAVGIEFGSTTLEKIQAILNSEEYKAHPELFTSQTLAYSNIEKIQAILSSEEYKAHPELFTSETLAHSNIEKIQAILNSEEYKAHPELFTSTTLAHSNIEKIQAILNSEEYKDHPELFTSQTLAHSNIEKIQAILSSEEYKAHPELFTSETLAHSNIEKIQAILNSEEYKAHPELFTSTTLAHSNIEKIQAILNSEEYKAHPELFTSQTLARSNIEKIQAILNSEEYKAHPELFTSQTLAHSNIEKIQAILNSEEYKAHPELFTSTTLAHSNIEDISELLKQDYWRDERYKGLLTSTILSQSKSMLKKLPILFKMAEHFNIDDKLNTSFLLKSPSQIYALIKLLEERHESLIVNGKLNPKFGYQPGRLLQIHGIDLKECIKKYPFDETILDKKDGFKDCTEDNQTTISDISKLDGIMIGISEARIDNRGIGDE